MSNDIPGHMELDFESAGEHISELESGCAALKKLHLTLLKADSGDTGYGLLIFVIRKLESLMPCVM